MKLGGWEVNVSVGAMPEKVATAFVDLLGSLVGAQYTPIAYLGSQVANGTNHAVLASQKVITGTDHTNVVLVKINEKPEGCTLVGIEPLVESGLGMGGVKVDVKVNDAIPEEALEAFKKNVAQLLGSDIVPFAYLGSQVTTGVDYIFAVTVTPVVPNAKASVKLVTVNAMTHRTTFEEVIG